MKPNKEDIEAVRKILGNKNCDHLECFECPLHDLCFEAAIKHAPKIAAKWLTRLPVSSAPAPTGEQRTEANFVLDTLDEAENWISK